MAAISLRDQREMKRMGYEYRAFFINPHGVPFHKDFMTIAGMAGFIKEAQEAGTRIKGYASRSGKKEDTPWNLL